jgi:hypothetical protein
MAADAAARQTDEREAQRRALARALALGLAGEVTRLRLGWYQVGSTSAPGQAYTVHVNDGRYVCSCQAGRSGRACAHAAAVYIAKVEHGGGRVLGVRPVALAGVSALALAPLRQGRKEVALV